MSPTELQSLLASRGHVCRIKKEEVVVESCWFCGNDKWNLELSAAQGIYHCWSCDAGKGSRLDFLLNSRLGTDLHIPVRIAKSGPARPLFSFDDVPVTPAQRIHSAVAYLTRRGVRLEDMMRYEIGVCVKQGHQYYGRIIVPVREFWSQQTVGHVARGYTGERPKYLASYPQRVIAGYRQKNRNAPYLISEGVFDGISGARAGFNVGLLLGKSADGLLEWVSRVPDEAPIILLLDGDVGDATRNRYLWTVKAVRPDAKSISLPESMDPGVLEPEAMRRLVNRTATS
jgi:hypothetical protein